MQRVLVLCTGNSCRSIMAEGLINALGSGRYCAVSAGSYPTGSVHPQALETLAKRGITVNNPRSKSWDEFADTTFDLLLTVCDAAAQQNCPVRVNEQQRLHWSIPDPAHVDGTSEQVQQAFESVMKMLQDNIERDLL